MSYPPLSPEVGGRCISSAALRKADIILTTTSSKSSSLIRAVTNSDVSHAILYLGGNKVIESVTDSGVGEKTIQKALSGSKLAVVIRHKHLTSSLAAAIISKARTWMGSKYDYVGAAGSGAQANPILCSILLNSALCNILKRAEDPKKFYCSELILKAFMEAGLPIITSSGAPQGLVEAHLKGDLNYVGHILP